MRITFADISGADLGLGLKMKTSQRLAERDMFYSTIGPVILAMLPVCSCTQFHPLKEGIAMWAACWKQEAKSRDLCMTLKVSRVWKIC